MNYNHLHYFHVIASEGSLARAAKSLNLSQSTLSTQLRQLEDYLEVRLFDRAGGSLRLTESGRQAFEITGEMFRLADRLEENFPGKRPRMKLRLEIGVATTVSRSITLDRFVNLFRSEDVLTRVRQGDHEFLLHELFANGVDVLITDSLPKKLGERGLASRTIASPEFVVIAARDFRTEIHRVEDLHQQPLVHFTPHTSYRFEIEDFLRFHDLAPSVVAEADDIYVIRDAVAAGVGFGIVPRLVVGEDPAALGLRVLGPIDRSFEIFALYHEKDASDEVRRALGVLEGKDLARAAMPQPPPVEEPDT